LFTHTYIQHKPHRGWDKKLHPEKKYVYKLAIK